MATVLAVRWVWTLKGRAACEHGGMERLRSLILLLGLTACSSNLAPLPGNPSPGAAASEAGKHHPARRGSLQLRLQIPKRAPRRGHSPRYISPATQSISLAVFNAANQRVAFAKQNLTPGSANCTPAGGHPASCSIDIALPAGKYSASIITYDGTSQTGNRLSETDGYPFTIVAGQVNQIPVVLDGVPASAVVIADANAPFLGGNQSAGFQLAGMKAQALDVYGRDADNNIILGAGAPTVRLASNSANLVVVATGAKNPNQFTVRRAAFQSTSVTLTAGVTPAGGGADLQATPSLQMMPLAYVYVSSGIQEFVPWSATPVRTITAGLSGSMTASIYYQQNGLLALDAAGNLYVLDVPNADVVVYAPGATTPSRTITSGISATPSSIALDSFGTLYVANTSVNSIVEYASGSSIVLRSITNGVSGAVAMAIDGSNNLFLNNISSNTVTEYAPGATAVSRTISSGVELPYGVATDGSGNLYVGSSDNGGFDTVTIYAPGATTPAHTFTYGPTTYSTILFQGGIAVDTSGDVCMADPGEVVCGNVSQGGFVTHATGFPTSHYFATAMAFDVTGQLYISNLQPSTQFLRGYAAFTSVFTSTISPTSVYSGDVDAIGFAVQR
jgi:hypothetical protein